MSQNPGGKPRSTIRTRLVAGGGVAAIGLSLVAAFGISGRDGLGWAWEHDRTRLAAPGTSTRPARWLDRKAVVENLPNEGNMPSLAGATGWINSPPLTAGDLRGKVVVVQFWTYSCINWLRSLPYVRAWAARYADQGLVVIGAHAPEFGFERDPAQVQRMTRALGITYPVAIDSDHALWRAFDNAYWPALYVVDAQGRIRHHHFGEGAYEASEMVIRQLLRDANPGAPALTGPPVSVEARGAEVAADWRTLESPETYVGHARTQGFASPGGLVRDARTAYVAPSSVGLDHWALAGTWTVGAEAAVLDAAGGRIVHRFHARDVHLVMGPAGARSPVRFRVRVDGAPPHDAHGADIDEHGDGTVVEPRLHQLIRAPGTVRERQIEIEFLDPGVAVYAFTFG